MNSLIFNTLKNLGVPVSFQSYLGNAITYITFFEYLEQGESYADNTEIDTGHYYQIDVWSRDDYSDLVQSVITALKSAGFRRIRTYDTMYEKAMKDQVETRKYHKVIRVFYLENQN